MRPSKVEPIVLDLRTYISNNPDLLALPSMQVLASRYSVSTRTILKALHKLREQGIVEFHNGSFVKIVGRTQSSPEKLGRQSPSLKRVCQELLKRVENGDYRYGECLPKREFIVKELHVAPKTVSKAFKVLETRGLIYKDRKSYRVGKSGEFRLQTKSVRPTILVIVNRMGSWSYMLRNTWQEQYVQEFLGEAQRRGILVMVWAQREKVCSTLGWKKETRPLETLLHEIQDYHFGTLVLYPRHNYDQISSLLNSLKATQKPIVLADFSDGTELLHHASKTCSVSIIDEREGLRRALSYLYEHGHRTCAYMYDPSIPWHINRFEKLSTILTDFVNLQLTPIPIANQMLADETISPELIDRLLVISKTKRARFALDYCEKNKDVIDKSTNKIRLTDEAVDDGVKVILKLMKMYSNEKNTAPADIDKYVEPLLALLQFSPIIKNKKITACITPNDAFVRINVWPKLRYLDFDIPRDLSLISFDNSSRYSLIGTTTIDWGLTILGHKALNRIIDNRNFSVPSIMRSEPFVVDQRTVAEAKK